MIWEMYESEVAYQRVRDAAPDMLAALIAAENPFHNTFADGGTVHKQMKAAIAKARGENL